MVAVVPFAVIPKQLVTVRFEVTVYTALGTVAPHNRLLE